MLYWDIAPARHFLLAAPLAIRARSLWNMGRLKDTDRHHLRAAEGWLGPGDYSSANEELEQIEPQNRACAPVLHLRWEIYATAKKQSQRIPIRIPVKYFAH
jgi:hypothetical protein